MLFSQWTPKVLKIVGCGFVTLDLDFDFEIWILNLKKNFKKNFLYKKLLKILNFEFLWNFLNLLTYFFEKNHQKLSGSVSLQKLRKITENWLGCIRIETTVRKLAYVGINSPKYKRIFNLKRQKPHYCITVWINTV